MIMEMFSELLTLCEEIHWSNYGAIKLLLWHLELLVSRVVVQQFVQTDDKETSKVHVTIPLWGDPTCHWWISSQRNSNTEDGSIRWCHNAPMDSPYKGPVNWGSNVFFNCSQQNVEQKVKLPGIWNALILMWHNDIVMTHMMKLMWGIKSLVRAHDISSALKKNMM